MPKDHSQPINEADRQARAAFRAYAMIRPDEFIVDMNPRTFQRIVSGQRDVPPGAAREVASRCRQDMEVCSNREDLQGWAVALELWAEDCQQRSEARHA